MRIRWEDVGIAVYVDNVLQGQFVSVNLSFEEIIEVDKAKYQGDSSPRLDGHYMGGRGTIEFRLEDGFGDPSSIPQAQKQKIKDRESGGEVMIVVTRRVPGAQSRKGYRISNCIINASDRDGENTPWSHSWNFDAEGIEPVA